MLNFITKKNISMSLVATVFMGASLSASADVDLASEIAQQVEKTVSAQMQEMINTTRAELALSLQTQVSEMLFDISRDDSLTADTAHQRETEQSSSVTVSTKE